MSKSYTSLVIPTWRRAPYLELCLRAILQQVVQPSEVIVVGRDEDADAKNVVAQFDGFSLIRWVAVTTTGHIAPVILGLSESTEDFVAFLDDDAEPEPEWLSRMLPHFEDPTVACVGGRVMSPDFSGKVHSDAGKIRWYGQHVGNIGALDTHSPVQVQGVMETSWIWRAAVLRTLDFDPRLDFDDSAMYGLDLCLQAAALGYRVIYEPRSRVVHHTATRHPSLDREDRTSRTRAYSRNYTVIALNHLRGWKRLAFIAWWWLVGERGSYGLAVAGLELIRKGRNIVPLIEASFKGKWAGMMAWRRG